MLHFVPWGSDGLSLDLMRRDSAATAGLNDFLIVEAIKCSPDLGVKRISLNFAVFRAALERAERIGVLCPFVPYFDPLIGRPSTPVECYLRLMFLKFRYRLGYESLCAEVSDSITWRRFAASRSMARSRTAKR